MSENGGEEKGDFLRRWSRLKREAAVPEPAPAATAATAAAKPPELFGWVGEFVEKNYRFTPKKRIRPQSFLSPKDRR